MDWVNSELIKDNVVDEIKKLKGQDGPELQVHGSGNLIQTLFKHDLRRMVKNISHHTRERQASVPGWRNSSAI